MLEQVLPGTIFIVIFTVASALGERCYYVHTESPSQWCQYGCCGGTNHSRGLVPCCRSDDSSSSIAPSFSIFFYVLMAFLLLILLICCIGKLTRLKQRGLNAANNNQVSSRREMIARINELMAAELQNQGHVPRSEFECIDRPDFISLPSYEDAVKLAPPPSSPPAYDEINAANESGEEPSSSTASPNTESVNHM